jgi:hypothetical protein
MGKEETRCASLRKVLLRVRDMDKQYIDRLLLDELKLQLCIVY